MKSQKGFTLLELLVVVVIIGILAGIALPQYQKVVAKSKSAQLKTLVSAITKSVQEYYLVHDSYPSSFDDIDVGLDWAYTTNNICSIANPGNKGIKQNGNMQMILTYSNSSEFKAILGIITDGPYKCTGFIYFIEGKDVPLNQLICTEDARTQYRGSKNQKGDFCEKVMNETYSGQKYSYWQFH